MAREGAPLVVSSVIGDVLDPFTATTELRLFSEGRMIGNGYRLRPSQVAARPRVDIGGQGDDFRTAYTLIMVDADSPSPGNPYLREYLHWLVTDIPGSTGPSFGETSIFMNLIICAQVDTNLYVHRLCGAPHMQGNEVVSYEGPEPVMGIHRVVVVLFRQARRQLQNVSAPECRQNFNIRQFSQDYNLGSPVAALYYNCHRENGTGGRRPC